MRKPQSYNSMNKRYMRILQCLKMDGLGYTKECLVNEARQLHDALTSIEAAIPRNTRDIKKYYNAIYLNCGVLIIN